MIENSWIRTWRGIADFFHVSEKTVKRWHKTHPLPIIRINRIVMVKGTELDKWALKTLAKLKRKKS